MKKKLSIKKGSTSYLKFVIVLIAVLVATALLWFPQIEGRNIGANLIGRYFHDPFLAYAYISSLAFFSALYQAFRLLGHIEKDEAFSLASISRLKKIKFSALALIGFVLGAIAWLFPNMQKEDSPGIIPLGFVIIFASITVATFAAVLQKLLQNAADLQEENELTV